MADTPQQRQLAGAKTVLALYSLRAATAHPGPMPSPAQPLAFARWLRRYRDWENLQFED